MKRIHLTALIVLISAAGFVGAAPSHAQSLLPGEHDWQPGIFDVVPGGTPPTQYCIADNKSLYECSETFVEIPYVYDPYEPVMDFDPWCGCQGGPCDDCDPFDGWSSESDESWPLDSSVLFERYRGQSPY